MLRDYINAQFVSEMLQIDKNTTFLPKCENSLGFFTLDLKKTLRIFWCCWKIVFCRETMIFRAKGHANEVVQNAISYIFVLYIFSRWMHRFREKWEKGIYLRVFVTRKLWVLEQKCIEMKLLKMTFPLLLFLIPLLLGCTVSEIFDVFCFSWNFNLIFPYYRRFLEKNTAFLPKLATFLPKKSINSLDFELRSSKIPYFRLFSCWEPKNGKFPRFWP